MFGYFLYGHAIEVPTQQAPDVGVVGWDHIYGPYGLLYSHRCSTVLKVNV